MNAARRALVPALLGLAALAFGVALLRAQAPPKGPVDPVWDRTACSRCRMLLSDPRFAAQAHTRSGEVHHFDDPGCLLLELPELGAEPDRVWFRHVAADRWLASEATAFVPAPDSPMGYGLAAVPADGGRERLGLDEAREQVVALDRARERR